MIEIVKKEKAQKVIHLGDTVRDAQELETALNGMAVEMVAGNNDWFSDEPNEKLLLIEGKRFFLTHGHVYGVKNGLERLLGRGKELGADVVLFGHTHRVHEEYRENILLLNPGSISMPASSQDPSCIIIEINENKINSKIVIDSN
jgi:putative phosphoesterase